MLYEMALNAENIDLMIKDADGDDITFSQVSLIEKLKTLAIKTQEIIGSIDLENINASEIALQMLNDILDIEAIFNAVKSDAAFVCNHLQNIQNNQLTREK